MDSISYFWSFFKMMAALAVVLALMVGAMHLIKKYVYHAPAAANRNSMIQIISTCRLDPKISFLLIEVMGQVLLVGVSNQEMSLLTAINDPAALEKIRDRPRDERKRVPSDLLDRYKSVFRNHGCMQKDGESR